jgi:methylenetetrahydrofolate reductase (NADPH)
MDSTGENSFEAALSSDNGDFIATIELLTTPTDGLENFHRFLDKYKANYKWRSNMPKIVALTSPHSPGGVPTLDPYTVLSQIKAGVPPELDVIAHVSCKDLNRNGLETLLRSLKSIGVRNILTLTGDMPSSSKPVFELDSITLLGLIAKLSASEIGKTSPEKLDSVFNFYPGAGINPYKYTLASCWQQYTKMVKKIKCGAQFLITQVGYDAVKAEEIIRYLKARHLNVPILGNVFLLTRTAAMRINSGELPGTYVSDELLEKVNSEWSKKAKGKAAMLERASQQAAFFHHLGFKGIHLGGMGLTYDDVEYILERSSEIFERQEAESYITNIHFPPSQHKDDPTSRLYFIGADGEFILPEEIPKPSGKQKFMVYIHDHILNPESKFRKLLGDQPLSEPPKDRRGAKPSFITGVEHFTKGLLVQCRRCGDCLLPELYYAICNESACAKGLCNIPCGDSEALSGLCGFDRNFMCAGELIFHAALALGKLDELSHQINSAKISELRGTSAIRNYFSGLDHRGRIDGKLVQAKKLPLIIIGESLHAHIPRIYWAMRDVHSRGKEGYWRLNGSMAYLMEVIGSQVVAGSDYIAINVDAFEASIRQDLMRKYVDLVVTIATITKGVAVCIDSSDSEVKAAGLEQYYKMAGNLAPLPLVNSILLTDPNPILELKRQYNFKVVAMLNEKLEDSGEHISLKTPDNVHRAAKELYALLTKAGFKPHQIFFDPTVSPIASDLECTATHKTMHGIKLIASDPQLRGTHTLIGLSNCSHMMPNRLSINRAYLQVAIDHGLTTAVLDPRVDYSVKAPSKQLLKLISDLADNDGPDSTKSFELFERIAEYAQKNTKDRGEVLQEE